MLYPPPMCRGGTGPPLCCELSHACCLPVLLKRGREGGKGREGKEGERDGVKEGGERGGLREREKY